MMGELQRENSLFPNMVSPIQLRSDKTLVDSIIVGKLLCPWEHEGSSKQRSSPLPDPEATAGQTYLILN